MKKIFLILVAAVALASCEKKSAPQSAQVEAAEQSAQTEQITESEQTAENTVPDTVADFVSGNYAYSGSDDIDSEAWYDENSGGRNARPRRLRAGAGRLVPHGQRTHSETYNYSHEQR